MLTTAEIRHGYTLDDLDHLTRTAILRDCSSGHWRGSDIEDRYNIAWCAIAEHLATTTDAPSRHDLVRAGTAALHRSVDVIRRDYGQRDNTRAFTVYWLDLAAPTSSPDRAVVERTALTQIWPHLTERHRQVLTALAAYDDHALAAESLGMQPKVFSMWLSRARRQFLDLWHEGEEPSRPWGNDRRRREGRRQGNVTRHVRYRKGRTKPQPVHGKASTYRNHKCKCTPCREAVRVEQQQRRAATRRQVAA
ncbi:hypothetical protein [Micrococcus luteus]|uniref:hypothetical protein n=1 Tax=Micrococcus luteus TaxID=1270 RepID=UPI0033332D45